jgi:hypothetical protein
MSIVLAMVVLFAVVWAAFTALQALSTFNYAHFIASILLGVTASVTFLSVCLYSKWSRLIMSEDRGVFTKIAAWSSVALAVDSLLIEPYLLGYFFPRFDGSLRWQCQLIVAGLLALAVAISRRSWRWIPFSAIATAFGVFWILGILFAE